MVTASTYKSNSSQIVFVVRDDAEQREYNLTKANYSIGRRGTCEIHLQSQFVSRLHATLLRCSDDGNRGIYYKIVDGNGVDQASANGILVNGNKVGSVDLNNGDIITFGPQVFARYENRNSGVKPFRADDPFDITLIDPAMMEDDLDFVDAGDDDEMTQLF